MNWFIISLVFHVLRLNLCVALSQACPERQYLNATGVCIDCTVCEELDKKVLRACTIHADTICGSVSDLNVEIPRPKKNNVSNQYLTVNDQAELPKDTKLDTTDYYYYDDDTDDDDYDDDEEGTNISSKKLPDSDAKPVKKTNKKATKQPSDSGKKAKLPKPPKYAMFPSDILNTDNISVVDPDTLMQRTKKLKKLKFKDSTIKIDDHLLKIGDTKFKIGDEKNDDGRWLQLSHPHIVDKKIYVDLGTKSVNKKGSTFFSSGEKQSDQEYINEMTKLLNDTASLLNEKHPNILNQTTPKSTNTDDYDNNMLKNLDDLGDDEDDDDEGDEEEDEDSDEDEDEEDDDDYDIEPLANFVPGNTSDRTDSVERTDFDMEDDYDLQETDFYQDRTYKQSTNNDIIAEPFVSTANWQILILVAAMSACLLFFIVVSAYICIFMRKRDFKTTFIADVEDISVRVNLMQHAGFEVDDPIHNNYIQHMRSVKSNDEKLPKIYTRNTEKK